MTELATLTAPEKDCLGEFSTILDNAKERGNSYEDMEGFTVLPQRAASLSFTEGYGSESWLARTVGGLETPPKELSRFFQPNCECATCVWCDPVRWGAAPGSAQDVVERIGSEDWSISLGVLLTLEAFCGVARCRAGMHEYVEPGTEQTDPMLDCERHVSYAAGEEALLSGGDPFPMTLDSFVVVLITAAGSEGVTIWRLYLTCRLMLVECGLGLRLIRNWTDVARRFGWRGD